MSNSIYNIFYTDDDTDDQEVFKEVVSEINEGIYIFTQNNGAELMDILNSPPPSPRLIFLDLNMPVKNGYEVLKEVRQSERLCALPIVIFSTSNDSSSIAETRRLGATLYVPKPSSYNDLKTMLRSILTIDWANFKTDEDNYVYKVRKDATHGYR